MSGQQIGTVVGGVVGGVIGYFAGNPYLGAQIGMSIGGMIGGAIDPTKIYGPHVGDGQAQSATDGSPISWVMGTAWVAGCIVDLGASREFSVKDQGQGKGSGTETYHYEAHQNFSILVCESDELKGSTIQNVLMVEQDGKIVYDVRPGSTILGDSQKYMSRNFRLYYGGEDQMPLADYDGDHGVGNEPAYRGVLLAFFTQFNKTAAGGRIPNFRFLVADHGGQTYADFRYGFTTDNASMFVTYDDGSIANSALNPTGIPYWRTPISNETTAYGCGFQLLSIAYGDPIGIALVDADGNTITDFMPLSEAVYHANQEPAVNYNPTGGSVAGPALEIGVNYSFAASINEGVVSYSLSSPSGVIGSGTVSVISTNPPAYLQFYRTQNGNTAATARYFSAYATGGTRYLDACISKICGRGGLAASQIDVSALSGTPVVGYTIAKQMNAVSALGPLLGAYFAYASEYDGKINFHFYGADAVMTIDEDDILDANDANNGNVTENLRNNATEFPKRIIGHYYDPAQNYMPVTVMQVRRAAGVTATGDVILDIPVAMDSDQAQQTVDKALKVAYAQLEGTLDLSVPFAGKDNVYLSLVAGDAVIFRGKRWIVTNPIISNGYIKLTLQYDRQSAYTSNVQAIPGLEPTPPVSRYSGPTTLYPMNLPSLRTQDTYGIYLAAKGMNDQSNWRGCNVLVSYDGQQSWQNALTMTLPSTLGTITLAEPSGGEPLTVDVGAGTLESVTADQLAARMNAFALVNGDTAEIGQFQTATQQGDGTWELTTVSRGLLGTTEAPVTAGQQFTMLDQVYFLPIDLAFAGKTIALRAVGFGENSDDQPIVTITYNPDTTVVIDGGEIT